MRKHKQTSILATLGPASNNKEKIDSLFQAGVDAFRLNFSHGSHADHEQALSLIRALELRNNRPVGIIADLQGPKLRIGKFQNDSIQLEQNQTLRFDSDETLGDETRVNLPHSEVLEAMEIGSHIFLDDGKVRIEITDKGEGYLLGTVQAGSTLSNHKGFNIPGIMLPIPALTEKDKIDLAAALDMGVDWVAQSFVQRLEDVQEAKALIRGRAALMAKIEKPSALVELDDIIECVDGIMLARGDLGVEIPPENVPAVQKEVVRKVRESGKPVVVATQMLESMIMNARPTRAEASDVATAVYDGADCVMLSAETAVGEYPEKAVEMMSRIVSRTESDMTYHEMMELARPDAVGTSSDAITTAAYYVAQDVDAKLIVNYTKSGSTALRTARQRPEMPILCLTPDQSVARRLTISYGIYAVHDEAGIDDFTGPARYAGKIAQEIGFLEIGDRFIMTAGMPFGVAGTTNILRVAEVEQESV